MSEQIHELFSSIAPKYDLLNSVLSLGVDRRWRLEGVRHLTKCRNVLDLCAGTLALTQALLKVSREVQITAVDFSQAMLERGVQKLSPDEGQRVVTHCGDFFTFEAPEGAFDAAMCAYGVRNLDDNPFALKKIYRLLKPGGRLVILEFFRPDRWYTWAFHKTYGEFVIPSIGSLVSRHRKAYRHLRDSVRGFYTLDQYVQLLQETGFEVKVAKRQTGGISGMIVAEK